MKYYGECFEAWVGIVIPLFILLVIAGALYAMGWVALFIVVPISVIFTPPILCSLYKTWKNK